MHYTVIDKHRATKQSPTWTDVQTDRISIRLNPDLLPYMPDIVHLIDNLENRLVALDTDEKIQLESSLGTLLIWLEPMMTRSGMGRIPMVDLKSRVEKYATK